MGALVLGSSTHQISFSSSAHAADEVNLLKQSIQDLALMAVFFFCELVIVIISACLGRFIFLAPSLVLGLETGECMCSMFRKEIGKVQ